MEKIVIRHADGITEESHEIPSLDPSGQPYKVVKRRVYRPTDPTNQWWERNGETSVFLDSGTGGKSPGSQTSWQLPDDENSQGPGPARS